MSILNTLFDIIVVLFFVFLNGFFVAAEFAIVKVRLTQIEPLVQKGNWRAKIAQNLIHNLNSYLSATQLGITMTSLALGWLGEPLVASNIIPLIQKFSSIPQSVVHAVSFGIAFSIITILHIVLGELAPKSLAIIEAKKTTLAIAYPLNIFFIIFKPIIWLLNEMANLILKLFGFTTVTESELAHSEEELRLLLSQDRHISLTSKEIVIRAMDFHQKQARHAMVPRKEIVALSIEADVRENLNIMRNNKYSRYPVYKNTIDNIIGIAYTKDIFKFDKHLQKDFTIQSVVRDACFVPETATLEKVLSTILQKKTHMLILADEYGGTAGIITLENVLEELVGNIQDEYDKEKPDIVKISENEYLISGSITTNDVERLLNVELSQMDIRSISGFVIEQFGRIPNYAESIQVNGIIFKVEKVVDNVVQSLRIKIAK